MFGVDRRTVERTKPVGVRGRVEEGAEDTCEGEHVPTRHERRQRTSTTREVLFLLFLFHLGFYLCECECEALSCKVVIV